MEKRAFWNYFQIDGNFWCFFTWNGFSLFSNSNSVVSLNVLSINKRDFLSQISIIQPGVSSQFALNLNWPRTVRKNGFFHEKLSENFKFFVTFFLTKNIKRIVELILFWVSYLNWKTAIFFWNLNFLKNFFRCWKLHS
jgi:hypothetical protein